MARPPRKKPNSPRRPAKAASMPKKQPVGLSGPSQKNYCSDEEKNNNSVKQSSIHTDIQSKNIVSGRTRSDMDTNNTQVSISSKKETEATPTVSNTSASPKKRKINNDSKNNVAAKKRLPLIDDNNLPDSVLATKAKDNEASSIGSSGDFTDDDNWNSTKRRYDYLPTELVDKMKEETKDDIWRRFKLFTDTNVIVLASQMMKKHGYEDVEKFPNEFENVRELIRKNLNYKRAFSHSKLKNELRCK